MCDACRDQVLDRHDGGVRVSQLRGPNAQSCTLIARGELDSGDSFVIAVEQRRDRGVELLVFDAWAISGSQRRGTAFGVGNWFLL
eukprot:5589770-Pleurochrysis_carterae.AAC.1